MSYQEEYTTEQLQEQAQQFIDTSFVSLGPIIDPEPAKQLLEKVLEQRPYDGGIFLDEEEYRQNPVHSKVNPGKGIQNLAEEFDLSFIEENPKFKAAIENAIGEDYEIKLKKFVIGVPESWMPEWLLKETEGLGVANLGGYIKPEYRNLTYFHGIDFHQDIIDFNGEISNMITVYVYLDDVGKDCSPLFVVPKSHLLGVTTFPHDLELHKDQQTLTYYNDDRSKSLDLEYQMYTGQGGNVGFWHGLTLHATQPHTAQKERLSLRYIFEKKSEESSGSIDKLMDSIEGELAASEVTRTDLNEKGDSYSETVKGNFVNQVVIE